MEAIASIAGVAPAQWPVTGLVELHGTPSPKMAAAARPSARSNYWRRCRARALGIAAALERASAHPLAAAFGAHADPALQARDLREFEGAGVEGTVDGLRWRLGRRAFAAPDARAGADDDAALYLGSEGRLAARIGVAAPLRADARPTVDALRALGLRVAIASGDSQAAVSQAARALAIDDARARQAPADKLERVRALRAAGHRVCMIGDGINDGPVLAAAEVSCARGQCSAIAHSATDLRLVPADTTTLPRAMLAARAAMRVVRQNLGWALVYNLAAVPLAALGLVPPWLAALGMSLSSLGVVLNARRLATPRAGA
jgi:Cu2+-exporting ATPase